MEDTKKPEPIKVTVLPYMGPHTKEVTSKKNKHKEASKSSVFSKGCWTKSAHIPKEYEDYGI